MSFELKYSSENPAESIAAQLVVALQEVALSIETDQKFNEIVLIETPTSKESFYSRIVLRLAVTYKEDKKQLKIESDLVMVLAEEHTEKVYFWRDLVKLQREIKDYLQQNFPELLPKFRIATELPYRDAEGRFDIDFEALDPNHLHVSDREQPPSQHIVIDTFQAQITSDWPILLSSGVFDNAHLPKERTLNGIPLGNLAPYYFKQLGLERQDPTIELELNRLSDYIDLATLTDGSYADIQQFQNLMAKRYELGFGIAAILDSWSSTLHDFVYIPEEKLPNLKFNLAALETYKAGSLAQQIEKRVHALVLRNNRDEAFEDYFRLWVKLPQELGFTKAFVDFDLAYLPRFPNTEKPVVMLQGDLNICLTEKDSYKTFRLKDLVELYHRVVAKLPPDMAELARIMLAKEDMPLDSEQDIFAIGNYYVNDSIVIGATRRPKANSSKEERSAYLDHSFGIINVTSLDGEDDDDWDEDVDPTDARRKRREQDGMPLGLESEFDGEIINVSMRFRRPLHLNALLLRKHSGAKKVRNAYFQNIEERVLIALNLISEISEWVGSLGTPGEKEA
jgi:hypothetical protein